MSVHGVDATPRWCWVCSALYVVFASVMVWYLVKGGAWSLTITDVGMQWSGPDCVPDEIRWSEVKSCRIVCDPGAGLSAAEGANPTYKILLDLIRGR